jgi:hypothetical protein
LAKRPWLSLVDFKIRSGLKYYDDHDGRAAAFFAPVVKNGGNSPATEVASNSEMFPGSHDSAIIERQSL